MKTVNAYWEKRNLGVDCLELTAEAGDGPEQLSSAAVMSSAYTVLKVPNTLPELMLDAQRMGFQVMEMQFRLTHMLKLLPPDSGKTLRRPATARDAAFVKERVARGDFFATDRVSLDPAFTQEQAGRRYANWIGDLLAAGETMTVLHSGGELVGFSVTKRHQNVLEQVLVGVFPEAQGRGFGSCAVFSAIDEAVRAGYQRLETAVSSNNPRSLRTHLRAGYEISGLDYVLTRHIQ